MIFDMKQPLPRGFKILARSGPHVQELPFTLGHPRAGEGTTALTQVVERPLPPARVIAIIPAHNEEIGIAQTIDSLRRQTQAPDRIIVAADNCTDGTVDIARAMGVDVLETRDNTAKKAGALNQGLAMVLQTLQPHDVVLMMDADSRLNHDFMAAGMAYFERWPLRGGISGSYVAADHPSRIALLQKIEYTQGLRTVHRRAGRIHRQRRESRPVDPQRLREPAVDHRPLSGIESTPSSLPTVPSRCAQAQA